MTIEQKLDAKLAPLVETSRKLAAVAEGSTARDGPAITVDRAAELLLCGRTRVFEFLNEGRLKRAPNFGRKTSVPLASVLACVEGAARPTSKKHRPARKKAGYSREDFRAALKSAEERVPK